MRREKKVPGLWPRNLTMSRPNIKRRRRMGTTAPMTMVLQKMEVMKMAVRKMAARKVAARKKMIAKENR
jgi:hypothetical protein